MELNVDPAWKTEGYRVLSKHLKDPRYPKPLTEPELVAQIHKLRGADLTALVPQWGGGGKLMSQFLNYVRCCNCACWPSWKSAWVDFAEYMKFDQTEAPTI